MNTINDVVKVKDLMEDLKKKEKILKNKLIEVDEYIEKTLQIIKVSKFDLYKGYRFSMALQQFLIIKEEFEKQHKEITEFLDCNKDENYKKKVKNLANFMRYRTYSAKVLDFKEIMNDDDFIENCLEKMNI